MWFAEALDMGGLRVIAVLGYQQVGSAKHACVVVMLLQRCRLPAVAFLLLTFDQSALDNLVRLLLVKPSETFFLGHFRRRLGKWGHGRGRSLFRLSEAIKATYPDVKVRQVTGLRDSIAVRNT